MKFSNLIVVVAVLSIGQSFASDLSPNSTERQTPEQRLVAPTLDFVRAEQYENNPGGATTHDRVINADAFSFPSRNMSFDRQLDFQIGNSIFTRLWVTAPSSTKTNDGLGPLFNARGCQSCHVKDGRGHPPEGEHDDRVSMLFRLSIPPKTAEHRRLLSQKLVNSINEPTYGGQLQDVSVPGLKPEARVQIDYDETEIALNGGDVAVLRRPTYRITDLSYGEIDEKVMISPRIAPQMIGLGLLESIDANDIIRQADPHDKNGDGISGKANVVWNSETNSLALGRFGLKAGVATLNLQNQGAFNGDIGLSTPLVLNHHGDCTDNQPDCLKMPTGQEANEPEISQELVSALLHYTRNLAVPKRRGVSDPDVLEGKKLFYQSGCIECHTPKYITATNDDLPELSHQLIWPYTDMLLHDMGEGLADNRPESLANGREWRTPPLWGVGLTEVVNGHTYFLHDGRARSILEAILWHGGEAEQAKDKVVQMTPDQRKKLLTFVNSL